MAAQLRECCVCREVPRDGVAAHMLPCLHTTCATCVGDIVANAEQKGKKPVCRECCELFSPELLSVIREPSTDATNCDECNAQQPAVRFCRECNEHLCKLHADGHAKSKKTRSHALEATAANDDTCCFVHKNEVLIGFCELCTQLVCGKCAFGK